MRSVVIDNLPTAQTKLRTMIAAAPILRHRALLTNLKTYREKYNLKQADLAELVGVRRETIVNLERGKYNPSLKLAMDIARVFHTTVEELFQYTDE